MLPQHLDVRRGKGKFVNDETYHTYAAETEHAADRAVAVRKYFVLPHRKTCENQPPFNN